MPPPLIWQISQIIMDYLSMFLTNLVDIGLLVMFYTAISISEENQVVLSIENVMDDDLIITDELFLLAYNIRREVINVLDFFYSFLRKYDNKKSCNMVSLMLKAFL
jgi:hypothetical protein